MKVVAKSLAIAILVIIILCLIWQIMPRESFIATKRSLRSVVALQQNSYPQQLELSDKPRQTNSFDDMIENMVGDRTTDEVGVGMSDEMDGEMSGRVEPGNDLRTRRQVALGMPAGAGLNYGIGETARMCPELLSLYDNLGWLDGSVGDPDHRTGDDCWFTNDVGVTVQQQCNNPPHKIRTDDFAPIAHINYGQSVRATY